MLAYTLNSQILTQLAVIERDMQKADRFGGKTGTDWKVLATAKCKLWWWKGSKGTDKSASEQLGTPQATIGITGGDLALPLGTDITDEDRIQRVMSPSGALVEEGPFRVLSVNQYDTHIECSLGRP